MARFPRIAMLELVKAAHATQSRNNGRVPYWMHLQAVAEILDWGVRRGAEITDDELRDDLYAAALGHDLYEDTTVTPEHVRAEFGARVDTWIQGMTNDGDDADRGAYLQRLAAGPEEVRLIKCADLIENMASCTYAIPDMGLDWVRTFFLPIAVDTARMLRRAPFSTYRRTAEELRGQMEYHLGRLQQAVAMHASLTPATASPAPPFALFDAVDAQNAAALVQAEHEASASGKELFSLARLEELWGESLADREASLKQRYYVRHPEIRSLADFVTHLREHATWE